MVRINKFLAQCNLGSRRKAEKLVIDKRTMVNGIIITDLSFQVDPDKDTVKVDGKQVFANNQDIFIMLNKPKNYLVTTNDDFGRRIVFDLLPKINQHFFPIGRLDYMSEGLLLFTNDGNFANQIIHPRYKLSKLYKVTTKGILSNSQLDELRGGVVINNRKTLPAKVFVQNKKNNKTILKMTIFEGRKRQIRRMLTKVGSEVLDLKRLQIGNVKLGDLPLGMWRPLKPNEIRSLIYLSRKGKI